MSIAEHQVTEQIVTAGVDTFVQVPAANGRRITHVIIISSQATFTADIFNRLFTSAAIPIVSIINNLDGKAQIKLNGAVGLAVGDAVTVATNSVGGYNTTHRITKVLPDNIYHTNQNYSADGTGGTLTLAIPAAEQPLYRVLPQISGSSNIGTYFDPTGVYFVDKEPRPSGKHATLSHKLVFKLSVAGTYRIAVTSAALEA